MTGWTLTQTNSTTIMATYSKSSDVTTQKDGTYGQNSATGFFFNFHAVACPSAKTLTMTTTTTWVYSNSSSTSNTWTNSKTATLA